MATDSAVTQRAFLTGARLKLSRLQLDGDLDRLYRQAAEISAKALNVSRVGLWFFDTSGQILNCKMLYDSNGEAAPPPLRMAKHPAYLAAIREHRYVAVNDARSEAPTRELIDYLETWHITSMLDAAVYRNGQVVGIVCHEHVGPAREWKREERQFAATVADLVSNFLEVNDRLAAEAQAHALALKLKDAHRLDALGRLAAGVAHDLNNMLGVITAGISVLKHDGGMDVLQTMEDSARHAAALVAQLMTLGRKQTPVAVRQPLDPLMAEFERLLVAHTPPGGKVVFDVEKGLFVWAEAAQLHQVLVNLVTNGFQAMPKPGVVVVRAHARLGGVSFEVIDTGVGIAEENFEQLFDPFFSTRREGHGIGLAVVQQIVTQHGGEVKVSSTLGDGSTFRVWWPSEVPG
jgi:two-component system, cell cycle sensor histidine kinase and response regulator CckA